MGNEIRARASNEVRVSVDLTEYRAVDDGTSPKITGHAALFDSPSEDMGFIELIRPGAFAKVLKKADCRALFNHNADFVLGRTKSGTLRLAEDAKGLAFEIDAPDTPTINDLVIAPMKRGDVTQCSFAFRVAKDNWFMEGQVQHREILEVSELRDISVVTYPAYAKTDASVRSALGGAGIDFDTLTAAITALRGGTTEGEHDEVVKASIAVLQGLVTRSAKQEQGTPNAGGEQALAELDVLTRRLELAAQD